MNVGRGDELSMKHDPLLLPHRSTSLDEPGFPPVPGRKGDGLEGNASGRITFNESATGPATDRI